MKFGSRNMGEPQNLLLLCEDVRLEIFKYLNKKDMENLSLTCKCGYDVTKDYFGKQTQLIFSKPLKLHEMQTISSSKRNYEEVVAVIGMRNKTDEIILEQLHYSKLGVTSVRLTTKADSNIREQISNLKAKFKTIKKVFINLKSSISSLDDIQRFKNEGICTNDITGLEITFNDFDEEFFKAIVREFPRLEELEVSNEHNGYVQPNWPIKAPVNFNQSLKVSKVTFHSEISEKLSFLQLFQGITTLIITECSDTLFLKTLLELNKTTLKTLQMNLYRPGDYDLVIPCQLHTLTVFAECEHFVEHLISNQNQLKCLNLNLAFTPEFLEKLGDHCAPNLNIKRCDYNSYIGTPAEIRPSIPELPVVKHLEINHADLRDFLPKTPNVEILDVVTSYSDSEHDEFRGFENLNGLKLQYLKSIDITNLDESLLEELSRVKMDLPNLESLKCKFNLPLLRNYVNVKYLEVVRCDFENIVSILEILPKLEELKVLIEIEDLSKTINHFESSVLSTYLRYVEINTEANSEDRFDVLKKLERKGDKVFSNYKEHDKVYIVDVTVGIDLKSKQFMYNFISS